MKEIRCKKCGKLLGKIEGKAEIKCPRCKEINTVNAERSVRDEEVG
jgi:LSD1 subclass zinc finger protein